MGDLGEALALIHNADEATRRVRLTIRSIGSSGRWRGLTGSDAPIEEWVSRIWIEKPDRLRVEYDESLHGHGLRIQNGARSWAYSREFGLHSAEDERMIGTTSGNEAALLLDPSPLLGMRLEPFGRTTIAGREALQLRTRPASEQTPSRALRHAFGHELPALEVAVDAERGILLRCASFVDGQPQRRREVVEVGFDEHFPPETFVWTPSADLPLPEGGPAVEGPVGPQQVSLEEAARLAAFTVFTLDLPDLWHCYPRYQPERPWKHEGPRPPSQTEAVLLDYHLADASHQLCVVESAVDISGELVDKQGVWKPHDNDGDTTWIWTASETPSAAGRPTNVCLKREGTILAISSTTLEADQLRQLAGLLRRVV